MLDEDSGFQLIWLKVVFLKIITLHDVDQDLEGGAFSNLFLVFVVQIIFDKYANLKLQRK